MFRVPLLRRHLTAALRDVGAPKPDVRISALEDLAALAREAEPDERVRALAALVQALSGDRDGRVRGQAALALADARAEEHTDELVVALDDPEPRVRQLVLLALGEVSPAHHPAARASLLRALDDPAPAIRFQALIALPRIDPDSVPEQVSRRLGDADAQVRYIALRIAEEHWLEGEPPRGLPVNLVKRARLALEDEVPKVRLAAAIVLARAGDRSGQDSIVEAVNSRVGTDEPEDAQTAVELSGRLGLEAARSGLARRAWGLFGITQDPFAFQARIALAQLGDGRAIRSILRDVTAWSRDTRTLAVVAAGRAGIRQAAGPIREMRGRPRRADPEAVEEALAALEPDEE